MCPPFQNRLPWTRYTYPNIFSTHKRHVWSQFWTCLKITSTSLTAASVACKLCPRSCLFGVGNKSCNKALDRGWGGGGTLNAFTCQKQNSVCNMWYGIVMMKHPVSNKLRSFFSDVFHEDFENRTVTSSSESCFTWCCFFRLSKLQP
jgi:hypothetical protein